VSLQLSVQGQPDSPFGQATPQPPQFWESLSNPTQAEPQQRPGMPASVAQGRLGFPPLCAQSSKGVHESPRHQVPAGQTWQVEPQNELGSTQLPPQQVASFLPASESRRQ
jgi:hypothetical protein